MRPLRRLMNKLELLEDGRGKEYADEGACGWRTPTQRLRQPVRSR